MVHVFHFIASFCQFGILISILVIALIETSVTHQSTLTIGFCIPAIPALVVLALLKAACRKGMAREEALNKLLQTQADSLPVIKCDPLKSSYPTVKMPSTSESTETIRSVSSELVMRFAMATLLLLPFLLGLVPVW